MTVTMTMRMTQILMVFSSQACFRLDSTSEDGRELLVPSGEKTNYFEKVFRSFSLYFESCWCPVERKPTTLRRFSSTCCLSLLITWTTDQFSSDYFDYRLILLLTTLTVDFYDF